MTLDQTRLGGNIMLSHGFATSRRRRLETGCCHVHRAFSTTKTPRQGIHHLVVEADLFQPVMMTLFMGVKWAYFRLWREGSAARNWALQGYVLWSSQLDVPLMISFRVEEEEETRNEGNPIHRLHAEKKCTSVPARPFLIV